MASAPSHWRRAELFALAIALCAPLSSRLDAAGSGTESVRGVVRAVRQASISTDLAARISVLNVREGEGFRAGDVLVEFDCRRQAATVAAADAQQQEMQLAVDKNRLLLRTQSVGKNDVEVAEMRLAKARAEADALRTQLEQCRIIAPFDGLVVDLGLQLHETSQPGKPLISIVSHDVLEIDLIVPSHWVRWLKAGTLFKFHVDELARDVTATVARIGAVVDPVSQTIKVIATVDSADGAVLPGMSGTAAKLGGAP